MSLSTFSTFYYGHSVTSENNIIDFDEGGSPLIAEVAVGNYTLTDFAVAVRDALNTAGAFTYTVSIDRLNRLLTISATGNFNLLVATGAHLGTSAFPLIGFSGSDRTGLSSYQGNLSSGSEYLPQFVLQDYVPSENFKKAVSASVNESANGDVEVIKFGSVRFTEFNIMFITNLKTDGKLMRFNPTGVEDANDFLDYVTNAGPIEFMRDVSNRGVFESLRIESTQENKDGIDYKLRELYDRGVPNVFETGRLRFRVLS